MRVVHLINGLGTGGGERLLAETVRLSTHESTVYCLTRLGVVADRLRERGIRVRRLSWDGIPNPLGWLGLVADLARADVMHSHFYYSDLVASVLGRLLRVRRRVSTRHDTGYWMRSWHEWLEPRIYAGHHRVACVSDAVRQALRERGVTVDLVVVPPGVDLETEPSVDAGVSGPYVLTVGRLERVKGHDVLVRAFAEAALDDWRLVVVGDGRERSSLEADARVHGISDRCEFLGEISPGRVRALLAGARLFVLPSRSEALPLALLEAMVAGVPCIASAVGGVPEVVTHGRDGWLVPSEDASALSAAIVTLATDEPRATQLGTAARATVEAGYGLEAFGSAIERLYTR